MPASPELRIIAVGDELLLGRTVDTNTAWLARWASDHGLRVAGTAIIGDVEVELVAALRAAAAASAMVLVTGGLGPTEDDRTRHALATAMGSELREDRRSIGVIEGHWKRVRPGQAVPASNRRQALVPVGAATLPNDRGTAPGLLGQVGDGGWVACMPGVPHEMKAMAQRLAKQLPELIPGLVPPVVEELYVTGIGESNLQDQIGDLANGTRPTVGITAHELGHITLRVVGSPSGVKRRLGALRRVLKPWLLPAAGVAASLIDRLASSGGTVTAAESCTCGNVVAQIGTEPGASAILRQSVVTYHNDAKQALVGVPAAVLKRHGAVSEPVVTAMASGVREAAGATIGIATSGIAGPDGGTRSKPVGTVWIAVAYPDGVVTRQLDLRGTRERIQRRAASDALRLAWQVVSERL